jgi:hypothetical protein
MLRVAGLALVFGKKKQKQGQQQILRLRRRMTTKMQLQEQGRGVGFCGVPNRIGKAKATAGSFGRLRTGSSTATRKGRASSLRMTGVFFCGVRHLVS